MSSAESRSDALQLLVMGGSQGAHALNVAMIEAAPALAGLRPRLVVTHQAGPRDLVIVRDAYHQAGLEARVEPFLEPMARAMHRAQMVVCRAGATTLAELAAVGRPSLLVPLAIGRGDHQYKNAAVFVRSGAAELLAQRELSGPALARRVAALAADPARRARMADAVKRFARPDAAGLVATRALQLVES